MAGRGTDIRLGGSDAADQSAEHDEVAALGGLRVIRTGPHRTERLDNCAQGRSGPAGDPARRCSSPAWTTTSSPPIWIPQVADRLRRPGASSVPKRRPARPRPASRRGPPIECATREYLALQPAGSPSNARSLSSAETRCWAPTIRSHGVLRRCHPERYEGAVGRPLGTMPPRTN